MSEFIIIIIISERNKRSVSLVVDVVADGGGGEAVNETNGGESFRHKRTQNFPFRDTIVVADGTLLSALSVGSIRLGISIS